MILGNNSNCCHPLEGLFKVTGCQLR